jgi:hypothetical protein
MSLLSNTQSLLAKPAGQAPHPAEFHFLTYRELYDSSIVSVNCYHSSAGEWVLIGDGHWYTMSVVTDPSYAIPQELCLSFDCFDPTTKVSSGSLALRKTGVEGSWGRYADGRRLPLAAGARPSTDEMVDAVEPYRADQDEIGRDNIVQQPRHEQNQYPASESNERDEMGDDPHHSGVSLPVELRLLSRSIAFNTERVGGVKRISAGLRKAAPVA